LRLSQYGTEQQYKEGRWGNAVVHSAGLSHGTSL
jgi:hypothetical protein